MDRQRAEHQRSRVGRKRGGGGGRGGGKGLATASSSKSPPHTLFHFPLSTLTTSHLHTLDKTHTAHTIAVGNMPDDKEQPSTYGSSGANVSDMSAHVDLNTRPCIDEPQTPSTSRPEHNRHPSNSESRSDGSFSVSLPHGAKGWGDVIPDDYIVIVQDQGSVGK